MRLRARLRLGVGQGKVKAIAIWLKLLWMFMRITLLTSSGPASVGLLYKDAVGTIMTETQFVEAVGFSNVLPGSRPTTT